MSLCSVGGRIHENSLVTVSQLCVLQGAMMSIAFKEGLKIPPPAMQEIILAANQDIRQVSAHSASVSTQKACHLQVLEFNVVFEQYYFYIETLGGLLLSSSILNALLLPNCQFSSLGFT